jgi:hypothetical protein
MDYGQIVHLAVHVLRYMNRLMKKCSLLFALCMSLVWTLNAKGDILIKSSIVSTAGGRPGGKIQHTLKIKGKWQLSESRIELPTLPGGVRLPKGVEAQLGKNATVKNLETGETWVVSNGVVQKINLSAANVAGAMAGGGAGLNGGYSWSGVCFKNTGKTEKVREYNTEIWESVTGSATVTVWVAPALLEIKQAIDRAPSSVEKGPEAEIRKAMAVLPGFVVKQRTVTDVGKTMAKSIPAGAKVPPGFSNMKAQSVTEVTEVKEITFSESDFRLPAGVK